MEPDEWKAVRKMPQKARNADYTKEYNQKAVLRHLRRQAMSRAELARATGLTRAGTSLIVEELLKRDIVTELAPQSVGRGRSATPMALRSDSFYALAVDLARKGCTVGLCDMAGKLLQCRKLPDQDNMVAAIAQAYLEHDVNAMALHQLELGQSRNFMLLFIDIGIGAAVMSGGKLLGNSKYFTGELGHTSIRFDGRQCECGNRGCLETYASIPALLEGSPYHSWFDFIDHVDREEEARRLLDQEAVYLSAGLVNLLNLIPFDSIFLAGDICYRYELLAQRLQREIGAKALFRDKMDVQIAPVAENPNVGVLSAAEVVFSRFFTV